MNDTRDVHECFFELVLSDPDLTDLKFAAVAGREYRAPPYPLPVRPLRADHDTPTAGSSPPPDPLRGYDLPKGRRLRRERLTIDRTTSGERDEGRAVWPRPSSRAAQASRR
jgi:hypothetical protein